MDTYRHITHVYIYKYTHTQMHTWNMYKLKDGGSPELPGSSIPARIALVFCLVASWKATC